MAKFRPIITALIVSALAVLPAASASAAMRMAATMGSMAGVAKGGDQPSIHGDCADHADMANADMANAEKDDTSGSQTGDRGACPASGCAKCPCLGLAATGVIATGPAALLLSYAAIPTGWATPSLQAPSILPPSPPPRA